MIALPKFLRLLTPARVSIALSVSLGIIFLFYGQMGPKTNKNEIRIVIDRSPVGLFTALNNTPKDQLAQSLFPLIENGLYQLSTDGLDTEKESGQGFVLEPKGESSDDRPRLRFFVVPDENTRALLILRGDMDVAYNTLSLSKTASLLAQQKKLRGFSKTGLHLSYLALNSAHPFFTKENRMWLWCHLPIDLWSKTFYHHWITPEPKPRFCETIAHTPTSFKNIRPINLLSTTSREGQELMLLLKDFFSQYGISAQNFVLDPTIYYRRLEHQQFDLITQRWFRKKESESPRSLLHSQSPRNFLKIQNQEWDRRLDQTHSAPSLLELLQEDPVLIPLFRWKHGVVIGPRVWNDPDVTLLENFLFLKDLRLKPEFAI